MDDPSRLVRSEIHEVERKETAVAFWIRATTWFAASGIEHIHRVLTDNGSCYRSRAFRDAWPPPEPATNGPSPIELKPTTEWNRLTAHSQRDMPTHGSTTTKRGTAYRDFLRSCHHHCGHTTQPHNCQPCSWSG